MQISYKLTLADYKAALKLHYRQRGRWRSPLGLFIFMPIVGAFLVCCTVIGYFSQEDYFVHNPPGLLVVPIFFLLLPVFYSYAMKKQFRNIYPHGKTDQLLSIDIDDGRIISEMPGFSESKLLWTTIVRFAQNEKITLFYLAKARFLFVPTQVFSVEQRTELNNLVARHGVKRKP